MSRHPLSPPQQSRTRSRSALSTTTTTTMATSFSVLPSPPTSPTSPRTAATAIRIKASRRPLSIGNIPSPGVEGHAERTRSMSPSVSRIMTDPVALGSEIAPASMTVRRVAGNRRQSSIAYYTPSSPAPSNQRPQSKRTLSSSAGHDAEPVTANGNGSMSRRSSLVLSSRSTSTRESLSSLDATGAREREPLTLVEKNADLLHFIAQKERKCLELRDQLAAHENELADLKRRWERIVNGGHEHVLNSPLGAGIGVVALDGLKEGVRMITAGFSDLGVQDLDPSEDASKHKFPTHATREMPTPRMKRTDSEHLSMSSMSSIPESAHTWQDLLDEGKGKRSTGATASSLSRAGSVNSRLHRRASRVLAQEPTTPTNASVSSSTPAQTSPPANLDVGMSLILTPSPTLVPSLLGTASIASRTHTPKSPVNMNGNGNASIHSTGPLSPGSGPMSSWMDSMGKKLSELQKGQTFSKSQKRASVLLAGVSSTISAALLPGPTATTPAPLPPSILTPATAARLSTTPVSTKSVTTRRSLPQPEHEQDSRPYPSYKSMADWLDDDEEQTVHAGGVLIPDTKIQPRRTTDGGHSVDAAVSSFDDDWNW